MVKTYEDLEHEVKMEDFVQNIGLEEDLIPDVKPRKIEFKEAGVEVPSRVKVKKVDLQFELGREDPRTDWNNLIKSAEDRGGFEMISEPEDNAIEGMLYEESEVEHMWAVVGRRLGHHLEFEGNPFAKAMLALEYNTSGEKFDKDVQEWLEQALDYYEQIMGELPEEQLSEYVEFVEATQEVNK